MEPEPFAAIRWEGDLAGHALVLDQTKLPGETVWLEVRTLEEMRDAIRRLAVRGAPAIGVAAAYGLVLGLRGQSGVDRAEFLGRAREAAAVLARARPTAVNLAWALERLLARAAREPEPRALLAEAEAVAREDREACQRLGELGAALLPARGTLLTHCNAGALATAGIGTALAPIYVAARAGKRLHVYVDETRPLWQGARLTAWELARASIQVTLITDSMAGSVLQSGGVDAVLVGADRIARNGDCANKIGTYPLAVLAARHGVPFYVFAPLSTFDPDCASGEEIPIEERAPEEVSAPWGRPLAPPGVGVFNPAFDVTPAELVRAIVTEKGLIERPDETRVVAALRRAGRLA
jgi:methylthioribose-1-phosphate isomerase